MLQSSCSLLSVNDLTQQHPDSQGPRNEKTKLQLECLMVLYHHSRVSFEKHILTGRLEGKESEADQVTKEESSRISSSFLTTADDQDLQQLLIRVTWETEDTACWMDLAHCLNLVRRHLEVYHDGEELQRVIVEVNLEAKLKSEKSRLVLEFRRSKK
ncbi:hypothetical protein CB1_001891008 [Camelus ferus]|nr:hypothetical protein CB1_001891008 [Camelus ferus]